MSVPTGIFFSLNLGTYTFEHSSKRFVHYGIERFSATNLL